MAVTARALAEQTGVDVAVCRQHLQAVLLMVRVETSSS
jgi:hypothetical protein